MLETGEQMPRDTDALSKIDLLVLSSLARVPMHGYELKLELQYRHVRWWAKVEHGHLYATLTRLEKKGLIEEAPAPKSKKKKKTPGRDRRVFRVSQKGKRRLERATEELGAAADQTYFDIDVFLASAYLLPGEKVVELLGERKGRVEAQLEEAQALLERFRGKIPLSGSLIIEHRLQHLKSEISFIERAQRAISSSKNWGPFLGDEHITDFLERTGVSIEA